MCLKKRKFCLKSRGQKKSLFLQKMIHKSANSDLQYFELLCQSDSQNPKSDSHFTIRHRLFPALYTYI